MAETAKKVAIAPFQLIWNYKKTSIFFGVIGYYGYKYRTNIMFVYRMLKMLKDLSGGGEGEDPLSALGGGTKDPPKDSTGGRSQAEWQRDSFLFDIQNSIEEALNVHWLTLNGRISERYQLRKAASLVRNANLTREEKLKAWDDFKNLTFRSTISKLYLLSLIKLVNCLEISLASRNIYLTRIGKSPLESPGTKTNRTLSVLLSGETGDKILDFIDQTVDQVIAKIEIKSKFTSDDIKSLFARIMTKLNELIPTLLAANEQGEEELIYQPNFPVIISQLHAAVKDRNIEEAEFFNDHNFSMMFSEILSHEHAEIMHQFGELLRQKERAGGVFFVPDIVSQLYSAQDKLTPTSSSGSKAGEIREIVGEEIDESTELEDTSRSTRIENYLTGFSYFVFTTDLDVGKFISFVNQRRKEASIEKSRGDSSSGNDLASSLGSHSTSTTTADEMKQLQEMEKMLKAFSESMGNGTGNGDDVNMGQLMSSLLSMTSNS
eukprot:CAMPEP_0115028416 /NCGR_PEP_ID=MMETSP0216-20121206/36278_1 /TAXON_ID=223996 /ORGANISM="Protocruzia adherens, Strain Boccale" /LENGTH=490 /DNA_ID=CAMNT_0002404577 /DNA_START=129 /DNA_END=1601 /DNA_ORIENTATION=+